MDGPAGVGDGDASTELVIDAGRLFNIVPADLDTAKTANTTSDNACSQRQDSSFF
jgi:hypothetical protein